MANLVETSIYETGIYQIEQSDPVMGGPNGISNKQAIQLGNRTLWLKNKIAEEVAAIGTSKANKATTLAGYGITNGYTSAQVDALLANKADKTVNIAAGTGLLSGGDLSNSRTLSIDKATASNIAAGTDNKVITSDMLKPELDKKSTLGVGQSYVNVKADRTTNIDYVNRTGRPILVSVSVICSSQNKIVSFVVDGLEVQTLAVSEMSSVFPTIRPSFSLIVPDGSTYKVVGINVNIMNWTELR